MQPIGTVQGLQIEGWGAVQNLGIDPLHRGRGLGSILLARAAEGFRYAGLSRMHLEVTTDNTAAIRLYQALYCVLYRLGEESSRYRSCLEHWFWRPRVPPLKDPLAWFRYAGAATV